MCSPSSTASREWHAMAGSRSLQQQVSRHQANPWHPETFSLCSGCSDANFDEMVVYPVYVPTGTSFLCFSDKLCCGRFIHLHQRSHSCILSRAPWSRKTIFWRRTDSVQIKFMNHIVLQLCVTHLKRVGCTRCIGRTPLEQAPEWDCIPGDHPRRCERLLRATL